MCKEIVGYGFHDLKPWARREKERDDEAPHLSVFAFVESSTGGEQSPARTGCTHEKDDVSPVLSRLLCYFVSLLLSHLLNHEFLIPALATATRVLDSEQFPDCSCELGITISSLIELLDGSFQVGSSLGERLLSPTGRLELVYFEELHDVLLCINLPRTF